MGQMELVRPCCKKPAVFTSNLIDIFDMDNNVILLNSPIAKKTGYLPIVIHVIKFINFSFTCIHDSGNVDCIINVTKLNLDSDCHIQPSCGLIWHCV